MRIVNIIVTFLFATLMVGAISARSQAHRRRRRKPRARRVRERNPRWKHRLLNGVRATWPVSKGFPTPIRPRAEQNRSEGGPAGAGVSLPDGWPTDIPIMKGFTITVSMNKGSEGLKVGASGQVPVEDTLNYYKALPGWTLVSSSSTSPGQGKRGIR